MNTRSQILKIKYEKQSTDWLRVNPSRIKNYRIKNINITLCKYTANQIISLTMN